MSNIAFVWACVFAALFAYYLINDLFIIGIVAILGFFILLLKITVESTWK